MIRELRVYGFRILQEFIWKPKEGLNILVGANSAGKSTVLDAIELVTQGSMRGQNARRALSPDWFNQANVVNFFTQLQNSDTKTVDPPEIKIVIIFSKEPELAKIIGCNGPDGAIKEDPGLYLTYRVSPELQVQFLDECKNILNNKEPFVLPIDYYEFSWHTFQGSAIIRHPSDIYCSRIDTTPEQNPRLVDHYAKRYIQNEVEDKTLRRINSEFRRLFSNIDSTVLSEIPLECSDSRKLGFQVDKSPRTDWLNSVILHKNNLPLYALGSAEQTIAKCIVSFNRIKKESFILLEEPECHLSHTYLQELISIIENQTISERQIFITTHSPFVLNRLGLDKLSIINNGNSPHLITDLSDETSNYFRKLSGYDTLRLVLAHKAVLVEGPSDEMVFNWAFRKIHDKLPQDYGIDVIECGTQHKRLLELAHSVNKDWIAALRDNDGKEPAYWTNRLNEYLSDKRQFFCGSPEAGYTLEPQMIYANEENLDKLATLIGTTFSSKPELENYMRNHKTEWALQLLDAKKDESNSLNIPPYIREAINFINPIDNEE